MQTDHIDLYQLHHIQRSTPFEEIWQAMEQLVREGKVIYVVSSIYAGWDIATAQAAARERHFMGLVSEQSQYNLSTRMIELEVIPACRHYGLGLIPYSPVGGGLLGGVLRKPVIIWVVREGDDLYVRSVNGRAALVPWHAGAPRRAHLGWRH